MSEKLTKIKNDDERLPELTKGLDEIEGLMKDHIDHQEIEQVSEQLQKATQMLHITGRLMEIAVKVYDYAKGIAAYKVATNEETKRLSTTLQTKIVEGLISEQAGTYARTDRTIKSLSTYIDGIRSLVSKNKEQQRIENYNANA